MPMRRLSRLHLLRTHTSQKVFKLACNKFDLVYFGGVSQYSDEHQMVRGFTLSPSHVDRHYCVGTVSGIDVILLERMDTVSFPDKPSRSYTWTILKLDLKKHLSAHILLNSIRYDDILYAHLFAKFHNLKHYTSHSFAGHDQKFAEVFRVYAPMQHVDDVMAMLPPATTSVLAHHFSMFDYEAYGDQLIVYAATTSPTVHVIEQMLTSGIWLATQLDSSLSQPAATQTNDSTHPSL